MTTPLLFAHGLESGPIGRKSQALIDLGYEVIAPDCRGQDLPTRVDRLIATLLEHPQRPPLLVGSSFGGIAGLVAALVAAERGVVVAGLVLCAPALMLPPPPGTVTQLGCPARTIVVHGRSDEVIPIDVSRKFCREYGATLREVDDTHALAGPGLAAIIDAVEQFISRPSA